jgi:hypothetical protein
MWAMRATLHVLPAADLATWTAGLGIWKPGVWPLKDPEKDAVFFLSGMGIPREIHSILWLGSAMSRFHKTPA